MKWGSIYKKSWLLCRKPVLRNSRWQDSSLIFILFLTTDQICLRVEYDDGKFPDKGVKKMKWELCWPSLFFPCPHMQESSNLCGSKMQEVFCFLFFSPKWYLQKQWPIKSPVNWIEILPAMLVIRISLSGACSWERRKCWVEVAEDTLKVAEDTGSNLVLNEDRGYTPITEIDASDMDCTAEWRNNPLYI